MGPIQGSGVSPVVDGAKLDSEIVQTTARQTVNIASEIGSIVNGTHATLEGSIVGGQFKGLGGNAAVAAWSELRSQLIDLQTALTKIGEGVGIVTSDYVKTDEHQGGSINAIGQQASAITAALRPNV